MNIVRRTPARALPVHALVLGLWAAVAGAGDAAVTAQAAQPKGPSFEIASVRPDNSGGVNLTGVRMLPDGSVVAPNASLRNLIAFAYDLNQLYERIEGTSDLLDQQFDVTAKTASRVPPARLGTIGPLNLMMQNLLAERFKLVVRVEHRQQSGYALVRATTDGRLGRGMLASDLKCPRQADATPNTPSDTRSCFAFIRNNELNADGQEMADLARLLSLVLRRPVVDRTGLSGTFQVRMKFDQAETAAMAGVRVKAPDGAGSNLPSLFTALQEELGLKLEAERLPARVLIIEHVQPPSPN